MRDLPPAKSCVQPFRGEVMDLAKSAKSHAKYLIEEAFRENDAQLQLDFARCLERDKQRLKLLDCGRKGHVTWWIYVRSATTCLGTE